MVVGVASEVGCRRGRGPGWGVERGVVSQRRVGVWAGPDRAGRRVRAWSFAKGRG